MTINAPAALQSSLIKNGVMSELRGKIDEGIAKGNTKAMKVDQTGQGRESFGLNNLNSGGFVNIKV
ncbi:MAG: hypothetical protein A2Y33_14055 [Spirochaetes bacterium GWF1_51_8]|nr:MAG: hypothetical protein A2Y33_14055 [Spirochaetes bacterium GWF1_51_8]